MEKKYHPTKRLVPDYIRKLKPYQAGKPIEELAREKGLSKIVKLASNENPLGPSPYAVKEMTNALWDVHRYPDMHAFKLKKALSELYKLKTENIILGNGSEGIMAYITRTFLQPGDEVLTSENSFIGFTILAQKSGTKLIRVPLTKDYRYDVHALAEKVNENTKIIYIANPNNPTGTYITKSEFDYLMTVVPRHTLVILDEAYFEYAQHEDDYPDSMDYRYDHVITLRTFSKAYGISGIRIGYGFAHEHLIENLNKVRLPFEPSLIAQAGAYGALQDKPHLKRTLENNLIEYQRLHKYLSDQGFKPLKSITNFITFKTGKAEASDYLYESLLDLGLIIRPLKTNEMPEYVRVSIGTTEEMNYFYECMDKLLPTYNDKFGRPS
jgi:histidinol-phosphate aminotransferase